RFSGRGTLLLGAWTRGRERRLWKRLTRALGLGPRAAEVPDRVPLSNVSTRMEIEWYAREVHPWDRDLPAERKARLFADESLTHTGAAIRGGWERFPEVDAIEISVLEPHKPHAVLFKGSVSRDGFDRCPPNLSPGMTLKLLGVEYRLTDGCLEPLG